MTNYIYDNEEVVSTGRTATRKKPQKIKRASSSSDDDVLIEIKPVNIINGDWVKWVHECELYEIIGNIKQE